jgi:hypothetical protein
MKILSSTDQIRVSAGMIGAPTGPGGLPLLAAGTTTYTYDDGSTISYHADGTFTATEADNRAWGTWTGAVTGAILCWGTPALPICAATGGLAGNLVGGSGGNSSSNVSGSVTGGHPFP